jgi:hypothetical protein
MLSTPALVRVSAIITKPSRTRIPQQYVMCTDCFLRSDFFFRDLAAGL